LNGGFSFEHPRGMAMIRIELLGGLRATRDAEPLDSLLSQRLRSSVLAYLAAEQTVSREALLRLFWPDREADRARHVLSQMLYELRRDIDSDCVEVHGERLVVPASCEVDVVEFENRARAAKYDDAFQLYRGPFLANVALPENPELEHWVDARRAHLSRTYRKVVRSLVEQHVANANIQDAVAVALRAAGAEPLEDEFHHLAIDLLARAGKRAEALRHFEVYHSLLSSAQLSPLDETVALVEAIRTGRAATAPLAELPQRGHSGVVAASDVRRADEAATAPRRVWQIAVASGFVLIITLVFTWGVPRDDVPVPDRGRVAVLPFEVIGGATALIDAAAFRAEIINDLTQSPLLAAAPRRDIDAAFAPSQPLVVTAQKAAAILLVDGTFAAEDSMLRLTVRFWNGETGRQIESRTYSALANRHAAAELRHASRDELQRIAVRSRKYLLYRRSARTSEAMRLFDEGLQGYTNAVPLMRIPPFTAALRGFALADSVLKRAESADAKFLAPTLLRVEIAQRAALLQRLLGNLDAAQRAYQTAVAHGDRAVRAHPRNADALQARGTAEFELWGFVDQRFKRNDITVRSRAERDFLDALVLAEHLPTARLRLADFYDSQGRAREQKEMALKARDDDPFGSLDPALFDVLARASLAAGQEAEAVRWCCTALSRDPDHPRSLYCELTVYAFGDSVTPDLKRVHELLQAISAPTSPVFQPVQVPMFQMITAAILARAGLPDSARALAGRARAAVPAGTVDLMAPEAALWTWLGDYRRALDILEQDAAQDPAFMLPTLQYRVFAPLRDEPRFRRILAKAMQS